MEVVTSLTSDDRYVRIDNDYWSFYCNRDECTRLDPHRCGKWMAFFVDFEFASEICKKAVLEGAVCECKHTSEFILAVKRSGVICFYLNGDDSEGHKKILSFMMENGLVRKTKAGKLYNIGFKYDDQTRAGEYGDEFMPKMTLSDFVDLSTGTFL